MTESKAKETPAGGQKSEDRSQETVPAAVQPTADSQQPTAKKGPTEAQKTYHKLVHTNTTGWDVKRLALHRKKCVEALAAKRKG